MKIFFLHSNTRPYPNNPLTRLPEQQYPTNDGTYLQEAILEVGRLTSPKVNRARQPTCEKNLIVSRFKLVTLDTHPNRSLPQMPLSLLLSNKLVGN